MVRRENFINKLRELDYHYKGQQKRTYLYRKTGGTHYVSLSMRDLLEDEYVSSILRQCGCSEASIQEFLRSARC